MEGAPGSGVVLLEISQQTYGAEPWPVTYPINRPCWSERSVMGSQSRISPAGKRGLKGRVDAWQDYNITIVWTNDCYENSSFLTRARGMDLMRPATQAGTVYA
jgi:hypothetical protein